ncbi:hypothetical protein [Patulibacter minatonensis]|uniref:hypothetical protein n=1 Tax=Patulibacter minatonensis TaxID=298163 RepID=UPI00047A8F62|nr:hypothetical protein [Patulibacter minatonensis]
MSPPNPLKPIQEALERVLHESGLHDFGRSMSSIDDLTEEVQHVYKRVDDIEQVLETIVPILERLTVIFEEIQGDLEPISELASKVPGSGSRRRRREREAAGTARIEAPARPVRPSEVRARREDDRPASSGPGSGSDSTGQGRPGATGYSPLGTRPRRDD